MRKILAVVLLVAVAGAGAWWWQTKVVNQVLSPLGSKQKAELPYLKYTLANLSKGTPQAGKIAVDGESFTYDSEGKKITGKLHLPEGSGPFPTIVMVRGYVPDEIFKSGVGTDPAAKVFAKNGYLTLAPDFLGFGASDPDDEDIFGARLSKPRQILDLIASLASLPQVDKSRVYLWAHSNGGEITLAALEAIGNNPAWPQPLRGAVLWAPVSAPFPYDILYYTVEPDVATSSGFGGAEDRGKQLRHDLAAFEVNYNTDDFSPERYWSWIRTPILLQQGGADPEVPKGWSDTLAKSLKAMDKQVTYVVYPGADHNLRPAWDAVVARDLEWYASLK